MSQPEESRLEMELELLRAMYPEQITYDSRSRDLKFSLEGSSALELRIPGRYPGSGLPEVLSARDANKNDLRNRMKAAVAQLQLTEGEEALDAIMASFQTLLDANAVAGEGGADDDASSYVTAAELNRTVIIWLHHLLALSKRKLALSPSSLSGLTKPGYPGVMVFSGPASAISEHVDNLKAENWQAFQIRYDAEVRWSFAHGEGIKEVETMAEVVNGVEGKETREMLLKALGIK